MILEVKNIKGGYKKDVDILRGINLSIKNGEAVGIITSEIARKGISIMLQGGKVFENLTVDENLKLSGKADNEIKGIIPILSSNLGNRMADRLSGGQRHQLALAMALLSRPKLVILDEPSAGLSPKAVEEMYDILSKVKSKLGITILLIEQNISKAISFCDRSLLIAQGQIEQEFQNQDIKEVENKMFNSIKTEEL